LRFHSIILSTFEAVFLLREVVAFTSHLSPEAGKYFDSHCEGFLGARFVLRQAKRIAGIYI